MMNDILKVLSAIIMIIVIGYSYSKHKYIEGYASGYQDRINYEHGK